MGEEKTEDAPSNFFTADTLKERPGLSIFSFNLFVIFSTNLINASLVLDQR